MDSLIRNPSDPHVNLNRDLMEEAPKIELIREPDDERDSPASGSSSTLRLDRWLATLVERGGSDLLLVPGAPASMRLHGEIAAIESSPLQGHEIEATVLPALSEHAARVYAEHRIADSSYRVAGLGRYRINLHRERGQAAATIRSLPAKI